jgi:hypothetical protein
VSTIGNSSDILVTNVSAAMRVADLPDQPSGFFIRHAIETTAPMQAARLPGFGH